MITELLETMKQIEAAQRLADNSSNRTGFADLFSSLVEDGFSEELNEHLRTFLREIKWPQEVDPNVALSCKGRFLAWVQVQSTKLEPGTVAYAALRLSYRLAQEE